MVGQRFIRRTISEQRSGIRLRRGFVRFGKSIFFSKSFFYNFFLGAVFSDRCSATPMGRRQSGGFISHVRSRSGRHTVIATEIENSDRASRYACGRFGPERLRSSFAVRSSNSVRPFSRSKSSGAFEKIRHIKSVS